MHRDRARHDEFLRRVIRERGIKDVVYIEENTYDGGYEVRVGSLAFFLDYETLETEDKEYITKKLEAYASEKR